MTSEQHLAIIEAVACQSLAAIGDEQSASLFWACRRIKELMDENDRLHAHLQEVERRADDGAHRAGLGRLLGMED